MANLLFDGFEHLVLTYVKSRWDIANSGAQLVTSLVRPGGSQQCLAGSGENYWARSIGSNVGHVFVGGGLLFSAGIVTTNTHLLLQDGTTSQVGLHVNNDGSISVYRGATTASTLIGTSAAGLISLSANNAAADYKMVEMEVVFATGATGSVKVKVGDIEVLNVTNVQTSNTGNAYCNRVNLLTTSQSGQQNRWDDFYLNDDTGSAPHNTFYGEAFVVERIIPNADGATTQWSRNTGANNYAAVDDTGNDDTDYVFESTVNDIDTYGTSNLTNTSGTVVGVEHHIVAKKDDVATREIAGVLRVNGTNYVGTTRAMTGTYALTSQRRTVSPDTGTGWTISEVNALELGVKVIT